MEGEGLSSMYWNNEKKGFVNCGMEYDGTVTVSRTHSFYLGVSLDEVYSDNI